MYNRYFPVELQDGLFISDYIPEHVYRTWERGQKILINASTGTGKSNFIINYLGDICYKLNSKALFLTNRDALQAQLKTQYPNASNFVDFMNYQKLVNLVRHNKSDINDKYAIIVADESHYFFADATFASHTDRALHHLLQDCIKPMRIFLSATTNTLESYVSDYAGSWNHKYSFIRRPQFNECYYWHDDKTIEAFLKQIPPNEKAIFFTQKIKLAYELSKKFTESTFVCSANHKVYGKYSDVKTLNELRDYERFSNQILFATSVIDNGINIKDPNLKHIIIDLFDYDSMIQCMGRRRNIFDKDGNPILPNLYIRQFRQPYVHTRMSGYKRKLDIVNDFKKMSRKDFCNQYGTRFKHGLVYTLAPYGLVDYTVNAAKEHKLRYDVQWMEEMNRVDSKLGHLMFFCLFARIDFNIFQNLSDKTIALSLTDKLKSYLGVKMFGNEKEEFKKFMKEDVLRPLEGGYKVKTINAYFEDLKLPYRIDQKKQNSKRLDNYGKRYWTLIDITDTTMA